VVCPYIIQFYLPNNIILLVTLDKFGANPILVNVKELKPCKFLDDDAHNKEGLTIVYSERYGDVAINDKKRTIKRVTFYTFNRLNNNARIS
jgi:hypothetical protein